MIHEIATLNVTPGAEDAFEAAVAKAGPLFKASKGCLGMALDRSIETPTRYFLRVEWETIEDHMVGFRESPAFSEWRTLVTPHLAGPPSVEHKSVTANYF